MEVSFVEISECCRCCMNFSHDLDNIFECFYNNFELHEILSLITGMTFAHDDGFPQSICDQCKEITMRAFDFRELCLRSDAEMQALRENEAAPPDDSPSDENFSEPPPDGDKSDIFACPLCQHVFESSEQLAMHAISAHQVTEVETKSVAAIAAHPSGGSRKYECHVCAKKFESPWKLRRHFLVHRDLLDPSELPAAPPTRHYRHECPECGKRVETPSKLARHRSVHDKKRRLSGGGGAVNQHRPHACADCPQRFWDATKLERHRFVHSEEFARTRIEHPPGHLFTCVVCLRKARSFEECLEHMRAHREDVGEGAPIACRLCSRTYPKLANLVRHSKLHAENATHECPHCGKRFGYGEDFVDHMLRHRGFRPHRCEHAGCGKAFAKAHKLRLHRATHNAGAVKCFQCDKCEKRFSEIEYLKKHLFRHLGIKAFACGACPARFATKSALESHATTHTNEKRFECDKCAKRFTKMQTLNVHQRIHRNEKAFACELCNMRFVASGPLKRHMRIHTLEKPYKCKFCEKAYAQSNDLMKHLKLHLGPNVYTCPMCPQSFPKFRQLKEHKMEHYKSEAGKKEGKPAEDEGF